MVKSAVKVIVRTRPTANFASKNLKLDIEKKTIEVFIPKDSSQGLINNQQENWKFRFTELLHNSTQEEVYETSSREIVHSVIEGPQTNKWRPIPKQLGGSIDHLEFESGKRSRVRGSHLRPCAGHHSACRADKV